MIDPETLGDSPLFVVHKSYQRSNRLPELAAAIRADVGRAVQLGVAINLPRQAPGPARAFLDRFGDVPLRIADPEVFSHRSQRSTAKGAASGYEYMETDIPARPSVTWVDQVLDAQRAAGATALLSPTGWVDDSQAQQSLDRTMTWVSAARQRLGDGAMFVALCLPRPWLADEQLRTRLLNEIVESNERLWYVRVRWGVLTPRFGQLRDQALLEGYQELSSVMSAENRVLVLPTTGLTGWLATAWGATGFSAGPALPEQAFAEEVVVRMKKGSRRVPRPRYFEQGLMHTVDLTTHAALLGADEYELCDCAYCDELEAGDPDVDPATWDPETAALHYLVRLGRLTRTVAGRNPRASASRAVREAVGFQQAVAADLAGENVAQHLRIWDPMLR